MLCLGFTLTCLCSRAFLAAHNFCIDDGLEGVLQRASCYLKELGVPEEAWPQGPRGQYTYTVTGQNDVRIQVLLKPKAYYIKTFDAQKACVSSW